MSLKVLNKYKDKKFIIEPASDWMEAPSNQEIIDLVANNPILEKEREDGQKIRTCFLNKRLIRTSDDKNEDYQIFVYRLDLSEDLQTSVIK